MNDMVKIQIADAVVHLPRATVIRNFLDSLPQPQGAEEVLTLSGIPRIGEHWPGEGGVNAGLMRGEDGAPDYYLIVCDHVDAHFEGVKYGGYGQEVPGADSRFDGMKNTLALINSGQEHPAAEKCRALCIDGHRDFYLPALNELGLARANVPELFEKRWYWSSTQCSAHTAWLQLFDDGLQYYYLKYYEGRFRAVRRFIPSSI